MTAGPSSRPGREATQRRTTVVVEATCRPGRILVYRRCASGLPGARGGRAIGAYVIGRRLADELALCDCCTCLIPPGELVFDVLAVTGEPMLICCNCGPRP